MDMQQLCDDFLIVQGDKDLLQIWKKIKSFYSINL